MRRRVGRTIVVGALLVVGSTGCQATVQLGSDGDGTSVSIGGPGTQRFEDTATVTEPLSAISLDVTAGSVTVRGAPGTTGATVARVVRHRDGVAAPGPTHRVDGDTLALAGCGEDCAVDYTVTVAPDLPVTGGAVAAGLDLTDVGSVAVTTTAGGVDLDGTTGAVQVQTGNGAVQGRGIGAGGVQVRTDNGGIDLQLDADQDVVAETGNGSIDLAVPGGPYRVQTDTGNGTQRIDVPTDPAAPHLLDLRTGNGTISVRPN